MDGLFPFGPGDSGFDCSSDTSSSALKTSKDSEGCYANTGDGDGIDSLSII